MAGTTLSQKVAADLRAQIADGRLGVGDAIPSQARLIERYGVSSSVTRKAVDQLRNEGLLAGQPGKAVFVQATPDQLAEELQHNQQLTDRVRRLEQDVAGLVRGEGTSPDLSVLDDMKTEIEHLRSQVATLRADLIDLYGRVGQSYPYNEVDNSHADSRRASGTGG